MLIKLTVIKISVNLPVEQAWLDFSLVEKCQGNYIEFRSRFQNTDEHVLVTELTEISNLEVQFIVNLRNPEEQGSVRLDLMAHLKSNSGNMLLGSIEINLKELFCQRSQPFQKIFLQRAFQHVQHQSGTAYLQIEQVPEPQDLTTQTTESSEKQETSSSDSSKAIAKQLTKPTNNEGLEKNEKNSKSFLARNLSFKISQDVIFEEVDLQDMESESMSVQSLQSYNSTRSLSDQLSEYYSDESSSQNDEQNHQQNEITYQNSQKQEDVVSETEYLSDRFLKEQLQIEKYLHRLQVNDLFRMRIWERISFPVQ